MGIHQDHKKRNFLCLYLRIYSQNSFGVELYSARINWCILDSKSPGNSFPIPPLIGKELKHLF